LVENSADGCITGDLPAALAPLFIELVKFFPNGNVSAVDLLKWRDAQTKTLSGGMQRRRRCAESLLRAKLTSPHRASSADSTKGENA
jgi:hypothetical protein